MKFEKPAPEPRTVLVAGGGIGGMQAALTAAARGHQVVLCEKSGRLGGVLLCEEKVPFKKHLGEYLQHQALMISREKNIEVRLNTEVTPALAGELQPDVIVAALGSRPAIPPIPGIDGPNVTVAENVYMAPEKAGKRLVILGGGLVGCELAIFMAGLGREVTVLEMAPSLNSGTNLLQGSSINIELKKLKVDVRLNTKVTKITPEGVTGEGEKGEVFFPADTVVCALGMKPSRDEAAALALCAPEYHVLGDCVIPATVYQSTNAAYFEALDIGKR